MATAKLTPTNWGYYTIEGREVYARNLQHALHIVRANGAGSKTLKFQGMRPDRRVKLAA